MSDSTCNNNGFDRVREVEKDIATLRKETHDDLERLRRRMEAVELNHAVQQTKYETILEKLESLSETVASLSQKPAKRWDDTVSKVIWLVLEAIIVFALVKVGLK